MKGIIINKNKKYNYILLNLHQFVKWIENNKKIKKSIENIVSIHRQQNNFNIVDLIYEAFEELNKNTYYFFIYKNNTIITSSRIIIDKKKNAYIDLVHTCDKYRNLGFCKKNIKKLLLLIKNKYKKVTLEINKSNTNAIKCYMDSGFTFSKINKNVDFYRMIYN
jgi:predicted GNAT family acetyltransferase